jgi:hypothetical protein
MTRWIQWFEALAGLRFLCGWACGLPPMQPMRFARYRVAPRLGTQEVRRRLLHKLRAATAHFEEI